MSFPYYPHFQQTASSGFQMTFQPRPPPAPYGSPPVFGVTQPQASGSFQQTQPAFTNGAMNEAVMSELKTRIAVLETELRLERENRALSQQNCDFLIQQLRQSGPSNVTRDEILQRSLHAAQMKSLVMKTKLRRHRRRQASHSCSTSTTSSWNLLNFDKTDESPSLTSFTTLSPSNVANLTPSSSEEARFVSDKSVFRTSALQSQTIQQPVNKTFWEKNKPGLPPPAWRGNGADFIQHRKHGGGLDASAHSFHTNDSATPMNTQDDRVSSRPSHRDSSSPVSAYRYAVPQPTNITKTDQSCRDRDVFDSRPNASATLSTRQNTFGASIPSDRAFYSILRVPNNSRHVASELNATSKGGLPYDDEDVTTQHPHKDDISYIQALLMYKPSSSSSNTHRTIIVTRIPPDTPTTTILAPICGGPLVSIQRMSTKAICGSDSMLVTFLHESAAHESLRSIASAQREVASCKDGQSTQEKTQNETEHMHTLKTNEQDKSSCMNYALLPTPTFPLSEEITNLIYRQNFTRCVVLSITNVRGPAPTPEDICRELSRSATGHDARSIIRITCQLAQETNEESKNDSNGNVDSARNSREGVMIKVTMEFSSISAVQRALHCLSTSGALWARRCTVRFGREACDRSAPGVPVAGFVPKNVHKEFQNREVVNELETLTCLEEKSGGGGEVEKIVRDAILPLSPKTEESEDLLLMEVEDGVQSPESSASVLPTCVDKDTRKHETAAQASDIAEENTNENTIEDGEILEADAGKVLEEEGRDSVAVDGGVGSGAQTGPVVLLSHMA